MKKVSHSEKILWKIYCTYTYIPEEVWYETRSSLKYVEGKCVFNGTYQVRHSRRSKEQWDFLHRTYHYCIQNLICSCTFKEYDKYIESRTKYHNPYKKRYSRR